MIEMIDIEDERVIGFKVTGKIDTEDFDRVVAVIENKLKTHDKLRIYAEIESIEGMSLEALLKDIRFSFKHFRDFEKEAVVTDKDWIRRMVEFGDKIVGSVEARYFSFAEKEEALTWVKS